VSIPTYSTMENTLKHLTY